MLIGVPKELADGENRAPMIPVLALVMQTASMKKLAQLLQQTVQHC